MNDFTGTIMEVSWNIPNVSNTNTQTSGQRVHLFPRLNTSIEETKKLWNNREHKSLQKIMNKTEENYEKLDFKKVMKSFYSGREGRTTDWRVDFLSFDEWVLRTREINNTFRKNIKNC